MFNSEQNRVVALAMIALTAACGDDWDTAEGVVLQLAQMDKPSLGSVANAVACWVDRLRFHMFGGEPVDEVVLVGSSMVITGETQEHFVIGSAKADVELAPEVKWASEIIDARITDDFERFRRAWASAPPGGGEYAKYVMAVLNCVATTIKTQEFGYALGSAVE